MIANVESYIFRYLLFMYGVLDTDNHICATPALQNDSPTFDRSALQARIKAVCKGHLRWCFEKAFLTSQSWPSPSKLEGKEVTVDNKSREEAFVGSLQMLKLFEFARLIREEDSLVDECLVKGGKMWLDSLIATQETKSRLWYKDEKKEYLKVNRDEGPESLDLPDYRLGDLIYIWKALKSLEELVCKSDGKTFVSEIQGTLTEYKLHHYDVRKIILQRFLYQPLDTPSSHVIDKSGSRDNQKAVPESTLDASSFSVAVRRSRSRDRSQFTTKDTMLYDGHEWGFFENDLNIEVLSNKEEIVKVNVELAWKRTMESQGDDDHAEIWEKPLRYALAIIMAKFGSLDSSKSPTELQNLSWKRLVTSVVPCGLFTEETDCYTQLPTSLPVSGNQRSSWEIPTLLSRIRFESLELAL